MLGIVGVPRAVKSAPRAAKSTPRVPQERPGEAFLEVFRWFHGHSVKITFLNENNLIRLRILFDMICITENVLKRRFPFTAGSGLIHGRHARILARIFGQIFDQVFLPGFWGSKSTVYSFTGTEEYSVQFYWDVKTY